MADLLQYMGPNTAAFYAGGQLADQDKAEALKQRETLEDIYKKQQDFKQQEAMNPLRVQGLGFQNEGQRLQNVTTDLTNQKSAGTLTTDIAAGNAKNVDAISKHHVEQAQRLAQVAEAAAIRFGHIPDASQRTMQTAQFFKANGFDASTDPTVGQFLQMDPNQLIASSKALAKHIAENSEQFRQAQYTADSSKASHIEGARIAAAGALAVENARIAAGKYNKNTTKVTVETQLLKARNPVEKAEVLEQAYQVALAADDKEEAADYLKRAIAARKRAAEDANNRAQGQPGINPAAVSGLTPKDRATATAPIAPDAAAAPPAPTASAVPAGKVRVKAPNGKFGFIPESQLQDALGQGYVKAE